MTDAVTTALRTGLESLRQTHDPFEMDCYYACPKSGECCDAEQDPDHCTCGADTQNAVVDQLLLEAARMEAADTALRHALVNLLTIVNGLHIAELVRHPNRPRTELEQCLVLRAAEAQEALDLEPLG